MHASPLKSLSPDNKILTISPDSKMLTISVLTKLYVAILEDCICQGACECSDVNADV